MAMMVWPTPALIFLVSIIFQDVRVAGEVFTPFQFHGKGDGRSNDTLALQQALDAAADAGAGTLWIPPNGTFLFDTGLIAFGPRYNGVTIQVDGTLQTVKPPTPWRVYSYPTWVKSQSWLSGQSVVSVGNVDGFTMTSKTNGSIRGFLFDEHVRSIVYPLAPYFGNSTNLVMEGFSMLHLQGPFFRNSQNVMFRSMSCYNRGYPEEGGNIEVGGYGSHGTPTVPLLSARNVTIRDSHFNGGDDNICIKNDTSNVLVENCSVGDGHGITIGSTPDGNGLHGYTENITFRGMTLQGNAPLKIKTWTNTTGMIKNILFEDITLAGADMLFSASAWYGKCEWCKDYHNSTTKCAYAKGFGAWGGACTQTDWNIAMQNITLRRVRGKVVTAGSIICREPLPCTINMEDVQIEAQHGWDCANAKIETHGTKVIPPPPACRTGPKLPDMTVV